MPIIQAPMFIISNSKMVIASSRAGIVGSFPTANARTLEDLDQRFEDITSALGSSENAPPWAVNIIVSKMYARSNDDIELIVKYKPPIVITSLGNPQHVVEKVHSYGGLVFSDVINLYHSKKAIDAGVDGLILVCNGAGGHTGDLSVFAFVSEVKEIFDGIIVVGGSISTIYTHAETGDASPLRLAWQDRVGAVRPRRVPRRVSSFGAPVETTQRHASLTKG